jgi:hypothetical protein
MAWCQGPQRFETDVTFPVGAKIVHVSEPLAAMKAQVAQQDTAGQCTAAAVFPAVDMETVEMLIAPGKHDLEDAMELRQGRLAPYKQATPDEWTDAAQDGTQLVDAA